MKAVFVSVLVLAWLAAMPAAAQSPAKAFDDRPTIQALDADTINAGLNPNDPRIRALVAYLGAHGLTLIHRKDGYWRVVEADESDWDLVVSIRSFPAAATDAQMRRALESIGLAYMLNAPAHLAMSLADFSGSDRDPGSYPRSDFSKPKAMENKDVRFGNKLNALFLRYVP